VLRVVTSRVSHLQGGISTGIGVSCRTLVAARCDDDAHDGEDPRHEATHHARQHGLPVGHADHSTFGLASAPRQPFSRERHHIDVFVSRTIVYGSLAVFITAVYVGIAVGIGTLVGSGGKPNLGLSILATAIVAVGFQPVRERLQRFVNRLAYGKRATPYEVLSQFSERVAESYASDEVLPRMAQVLAEGTAADLAEVWLRSGDVLQRAAVFPLQPSAPAAVPLNGVAELAIPAADRSVEVRHQGEVLGALTVTKRRGESLTPIEIKLMDDLAHQAGLVLKNVGLTSDL
jgi:hypothetical protein